MSSETWSEGGRQRGIELAHFWQEGDGQQMVEALIDGFRSRHPGADVEATYYGNHGLSIKTRILRGDPPTLFAEWPGKNLEPYYRAGALQTLTDVWQENGWDDAFVQGPKRRVSFDGDYVGVPVTIHRMNDLFYHVDLIEEYGVNPGRIESPREFLRVMRQLDDEDVVGMHQPMQNPWTVLQLFAVVLIGQFGADVYDAVTRGNVAGHESEIRETVSLLDAYADLASDDAMFLDMVEANARFMDGDSVFFHQGDWVTAEYRERSDFEYGRDWEHVPFPGTDGVFMTGMDILASASNAAFDETARSFLEFVGSTQALKTVSRTKGSIPPRRDVSLDGFPPFIQAQYRDFKDAKAFPAGHSIEVEPESFVEVRTTFASFIQDRDVDETAERLVDAYGMNGSET